jgi:hypothetical protein
VGVEQGPLSLASTIEELLKEKVAAPVKKTEITAVRDPPRRLHNTPLSKKIDINFADKRWALGRCS